MYDIRMYDRYAPRRYENLSEIEKDVLQWYIEMNEGGTPHTKEEIQKVKDMVAKL